MSDILLKYTDKEDLARLVEVKTIGEYLDYIEKEYKDLVAIDDLENKITFDKLYNNVKEVCKELNDNNIAKHTNVGVIGRNSYMFVKYALGAMANSNVATLLPVQLDEKMIYGCTLKYNLTCLFYDEILEEKVKFAKNAIPNVKFIKMTDFNGLSNGAIDYTIKASDDACIVLTGGTTGRSKGAILSHEALLKGVYNGCLGVKNVYNQRYYSLMPLTHVFGFIRNLMTSLYTGSTICFCKDMKAMVKEMQVFKPSILVVVPALAELFLNLIKGFGMQLMGGNLKTIICGGASVPPYLVTEFIKLGICFAPGYGLTETANLVSGNPIGNDEPHSVGYFYPDEEYKVVDGELWLKGKNLFKCYYNEPEENKIAFSDGWFKTGDLVEVKNDLLYIVGRIKDIIVMSNGENVSPAYIEAKVNDLVFIQDSLVYQDKNDLGMDILTCEVVLRQSVIKAMNIENVKEFVDEKINELNKTLFDYERISKVIIRTEDFARSPSMKIIRPKRDL